MKLSRTIVVLAFFAALLIPSNQEAAPGGDGVAGYSLPKIKPTGFNVYQGILDWAPVSSTKAVAFARNMVDGSYAYSLKSFVLSKTGGASSSRTIATGMGVPLAAAALWIEAGGPTESAGSYGFVYVLFEVEESDPRREIGSLRMAKFDASGKRIGNWAELLRVELGEDQYFSDANLFASRGAQTIGIAPSFAISARGSLGGETSRLYFLEASPLDGLLTSATITLPLPEPTRDVQALAARPSWTGTGWLIPAAATVYKKGGNWEDIVGNRALVYSVSNQATLTVARREIARDGGLTPDAYGALALTPLPGGAGDQLLFVRHRKPVPESRRKLDMFQYDYSLKRLDPSGKILKNTVLTFPAPAHKLTYDPAYEFQWEWDEWSEGLARKGKIYLSQCRSIEIYRGSQDRKCEQQVNFFEIDPLAGAVEHRARAVTVWNEVLLFQPLIDAFPGGPIAVVNRAYHTPSPYAWDNYITRFGD
jgi:hypothetical protein